MASEVSAIRLRVSVEKMVGDKKQTRTRSFSNIKQEATNEHLYEAGESIASLLDGTQGNILKVQEEILTK